MAHPYMSKEFAELGRAPEERWPLLDPSEDAYWISRWQRGISPYSRIRSHAIRRQLDAIIALAPDFRPSTLTSAATLTPA